MAIESISGQTLSAALGALKTVYIGGMQAIFPTDTSTLKWLKHETEGFEGFEIKGAKNVARNQGFGASHAPDDDLRIADPHRNTYANPKATMGNFSMRGKIPGKLMQRVKTDRGGFIKLLVADQHSLMRDSAQDMDRQCYGDGSGRVALVTSVASASAGSLVLKHPFDCPAHATAGQQGEEIERHGVQVGGVYALVDESASAAGVGTQDFHVTNPTSSVNSLTNLRHFMCSAISGNTATFTTVGGTPVDFRLVAGGPIGDMRVAVAVGDALVRCIVRDSGTTPTSYTSSTSPNLEEFHSLTGYRKKDLTETANTHYGMAELAGFPLYCSQTGGFLEYAGSGTITAGNVEGVSFSTYPDWKGYVQQGATPGTAEAGTRRKFMNAMLRIQLRGEKSASRIFTNPVVLTNMIEKFVHSDIQYNQVQSTTEIAGRDVTFQGVPIVTSEACPASAAFMCPDGALKFYSMMDIEWVNQDGAILSRMGDNYSFQYSAVMFAQTFAERMNQFAAIYDLQSAAW